jgi:hypothetical protein
MIVAFLPLCKGCFLQCKSGKTPSLELRDGLGHAKYNVTTSKIEFPSGVPKSRLPGNRRPKVARKVLVFPVVSGVPALMGSSRAVAASVSSGDALVSVNHALLSYNDCFAFMAEAARSVGVGKGDGTVKCLLAASSSGITFFVDSGAGQFLCSVETAFSELRPCRIEVTGVSGSLPIHGYGTANFVASDHNGNQLIVRIPNCLYGRSEFNLLSVSQFNQVCGNRVDFSLDSPAMVLIPPPGVIRPPVRVPLILEDGLFALRMEPLEEGRGSAL